MEAAYLARDFDAFAKLAMQDSNQFHATCLDTYPPIFYLTDGSRSVIQMCHALNDAFGKVIVGYTFDAGPNAVLLTTKAHASQVLAAVLKYFPPPPETAATFVNKPELRAAAKAVKLPESLAESFKLAPQSGTIKYVYATGIGPGAMELPESASLADERGMPLLPPEPPKMNTKLPLYVALIAAAAFTILKKL